MLTFSFFLMLGIIGSVVFLIVLVFDGLLDFGGEIVPTLAFFVAMMGLTGAFTESLMEDPNVLVYSLVGVLAATFSSSLFFVVYRTLRGSLSSENSTPRELSSIVGQPVSIDWWNGTRGEVNAPWPGGSRKIVSAKSDEDLKTVKTAYIVSVETPDLIVISSTPPSL